VTGTHLTYGGGESAILIPEMEASQEKSRLRPASKGGLASPPRPGLRTDGVDPQGEAQTPEYFLTDPSTGSIVIFDAVTLTTALYNPASGRAVFSCKSQPLAAIKENSDRSNSEMVVSIRGSIVQRNTTNQ
jgi:hypothetical protein